MQPIATTQATPPSPAPSDEYAAFTANAQAKQLRYEAARQEFLTPIKDTYHGR
jgi:hypothetical protein